MGEINTQDYTPNYTNLPNLVLKQGVGDVRSQLSASPALRRGALEDSIIAKYLEISKQDPEMVKCVIIENPRAELEILSRIAALRGDRNTISAEDYNHPDALGLLKQLQGQFMYNNDTCPWHAQLIGFYDLGTALQMLTEIYNSIGPEAFANSKVVFEELLFGLNFKGLLENARLTAQAILQKLLSPTDFANIQSVFQKPFIGDFSYGDYAKIQETVTASLAGIRQKMSPIDFANSEEVSALNKAIQTIKSFNLNLSPREPGHNIITRAFIVPKTGGSRQVDPTLRALPRNTQETLFNLKVFEKGNILLGRVIQHPDRELRLLQEIAAADGDRDSISDADMRAVAYQQKLNQLEGYRLYTNDPGTDATQADLNNAYALLHDMSGRYDLTHTNVLLSEKLVSSNARREVTNAQIILNEELYSEITNFVDFYE